MMWKVLDQYIKNIGISVHLNFKETILFYMDNFLYYNDEYFKFRKIVEQERKRLFEKIKVGENIAGGQENLIIQQETINKYILSFFILLIIERAKMFESEKEFKKRINKLGLPTSYVRLRNGEKEDVKSLSRMIIHFRDACVHHIDEEISRLPEFKGHEDSDGGNIHLKFAVDYPSEAWVFMIGEGRLHLNKVKEIINETLKYFFT